MKKHFLDNLMLHLNSISRLAAIENAVQTQTHTGKIINSIRYKTSRMDQLLPINEEIKAIENFIDIFKLRFGDSLLFELSMDIDAASSYIPHYTVMTFVENALYHAFETSEITKELKVAVVKNERAVIIEILDNGCGFEPKKYLQGNVCGQEYGTIFSTIKRLASHFSKPDVVHIKSCRGKGTAIVINLPL